MKAKGFVDDGLPIPDQKMTVNQWLDWYLIHSAPRNAKATTVEGYKWLLNRYARPHIGYMKMAELTSTSVEEMLTRLERDGRAPRTLRQVRTVLRRAMQVAVAHNIIVRNVVDAVEPPKIGRSKTDDALTDEEADRLRQVITGHRLHALFELALAVGMRKGELLALRWNDVDFDKATVSIHGSLRRVNKVGLRVDTPKSERSSRVIDVPDYVMQTLRAHKDAQVREAKERTESGAPWHLSGHVFVSPIGTPIDPRNLTREYHKVIKAARLQDKPRLHGLRHSAATFMTENGTPLVGARVNYNDVMRWVHAATSVGTRR
jgi:integrase